MLRLRLRSIFALLVLVTAVPLALLASWVTWRSWHQEQALVDRQNVEQARAVGVAIDQEIERTIAELKVLGLSDPIDDPDKTQFTGMASRVLPLHPEWESIRLLIAAIRAEPRTTALPAVAITAYTRPEDRERILSAGYNAHVGKPLDPRALIGVLAELAQP